MRQKVRIVVEAEVVLLPHVATAVAKGDEEAPPLRCFSALNRDDPTVDYDFIEIRVPAHHISPDGLTIVSIEPLYVDQEQAA